MDKQYRQHCIFSLPVWWGTLTPVWQPVSVQQMPNGQRASLGQSLPSDSEGMARQGNTLGFSEYESVALSL